MNKFKILCFILLIEIFSSLLLEPNFGSTKKDFSKCKNHTDTKQCSSVIFDTKNFQCCNLKSKEKGIEECDVMVKPLQSANDELKTENGKIITREFGGYNLFSNDSDIKFNDHYFTCKDGELNFIFDPKSYNDEEKAKYKSDKHCIYYSSLEYQQENITKETCYNAILASTGNSGVSCGYYEFKLNFDDKTKGDYHACFLFNEDILKTKNLGLWTKMMTEEIATNAEYELNKTYSNYQFTATNSKGKSFIYYSINDTIIASDSSNLYLSRFFNSRYILLLILFLI